jgi:hypothetical protein
MSISGFPAGLGLSAGNNMFSDMDARMELADSVTGNETPEQLAQIQAKDKQLALKKVKNELLYNYTDAWQEQLDRKIQKDRAQKKRLFDLGFLYG